MEEIEFEPDEVILKQGENAGDDSGFYIIVYGEALVYVNDDTPVTDNSDDDDSKLGILVNHLFRSNFLGKRRCCSINQEMQRLKSGQMDRSGA